MTVAVWPSTLPRPMRDGFSAGLADVRRFTPDEAGMPKARARFSAGAAPLAYPMEVDRDGVATLETFYSTTLKRGTLPFLMPDPTTDAWALRTAGAEVTDEAAETLLAASWWLVMFGQGSPQYRVVGVRFRYALNLLILP